MSALNFMIVLNIAPGHCILLVLLRVQVLISVGWGREMSVPCIGAVLRSCYRNRVTVVEFRVFLYLNSLP